MDRKARLIAVVAIGFAAALSFAEPVAAGTCSQVKAKGKGPTIAAATANAQADLKQKAKSMGGKVNQTSTNCTPNPTGYVCKISAVVCPK